MSSSAADGALPEDELRCPSLIALSNEVDEPPGRRNSAGGGAIEEDVEGGAGGDRNDTATGGNDTATGENDTATSEDGYFAISVWRLVVVGVLAGVFCLSGLLGASYFVSRVVGCKCCWGASAEQVPPSKSPNDEAADSEPAKTPKRKSTAYLSEAQYAVLGLCGAGGLCWAGYSWMGCAAADRSGEQRVVANGSVSPGSAVPVVRDPAWFDEKLLHKRVPERWPCAAVSWWKHHGDAGALFAKYQEFMASEVQPKRDKHPYLTSIVFVVDACKLSVDLPVFTNERGKHVEATLKRAGDEGGLGPFHLCVDQGNDSAPFFRRCSFDKPGLYHLTIKDFDGWAPVYTGTDRSRCCFGRFRSGAIDVWLGERGLTTLHSAFHNYENLLHLGVADTSKVTDMHGMLSLTSFAQPVNSAVWDTREVTDMSALFSHTAAATPETTWWNVSKVANMRKIFWKAVAANPETTWWNVGNVEDMEKMFDGARAAKPVTTWWDVSKVEEMLGMFEESDFSPVTKHWNTTRMRDGFTTLRETPNLILQKGGPLQPMPDTRPLPEQPSRTRPAQPTTDP